MSNTIAILNDSYSRRVYYGQCLTNTVDHIYHANFCSYVEILQGSVDFMPSSIDFVCKTYCWKSKLFFCVENIKY